MSALSNARWLILIQAYKVSLQLVAMGVLTRLLPPSDYGLMAMAWTAANFASLLKDLGTSSAIIQKKELSERTKSTIFWLQMSLSGVLCASLILLSGVISAAFRQPALQPILCLLALTFPIGSLSSVHQALLERQSKFQTLARFEIVSSSVSLTVAIVAALRGAGVYSFVWQSFTVTLLYVVQSWISSPWRPALTWDREGIRQIFGYSGNLSAFNLIVFLARNADSMIIGRFLGAAALGTYSMAYKLMLFPLQNLTTVASRALFPIMSRQQDSNNEIAALYTRAAGMVAAIATPLMGGLFVLREPLSRVMFGGQWGDVTHVIAWLAPVGAMQAVMSTTGAIFMAKGRTDIMLRLGAFSAAVVVSAFFAGLPGGIVGVAMAYLASNVVTSAPGTYYACKLIDLPYRRFLGGLVAPVVSTLAMCPVVYLFARWMSPFGDLPVLIVASCMGALAYFAYYLIFFRKVMMELLRVVLGNKLSSRFSGAAGASAPRSWLLVDIAPNFGGHEVMLLRWIEELVKSGNVVPVLVCLEGSRLAEQAAGVCRMVTLKHQGRGRTGKLMFFVRLVTTLVQSRFRLRPELAVVAEGSLFAQRFGLYASRLTGYYTVMYVPLVSSFSNMAIPDGATLDRKVKRFYGRLPSAWLTIAPDQAYEFRQWSGVTQPIFTLPNTVQSHLEGDCKAALDRQRANCAERQADADADGRMRVLVLGRLEPHQKGLDLLLQHLLQQPELSDRFVVHFAGEGPYEATLREAKQRDPRLDRLLALEPWGDAREVFARHDALLLPSRFEGVPLVMLEAMAFGLPVVASDLAGTRGYLPANCIRPVGQVGQMFDCLASLHTSRLRRFRIAERNLMAFKALASGAAFATAVSALTLQIRQARHGG